MPDGSALVVSTAAATTRVPLDGSAPVVLVDATRGHYRQGWDRARRIVDRRPGGRPLTWCGSRCRTPRGPSFYRPPNRRRHEHRRRRVRVDRAGPMSVWVSAEATLTHSRPASRSSRTSASGSRHRHHPARRRGPGITGGRSGPDDRVLVAESEATTLWGTTGEQVTSLDLAADIPVQSGVSASVTARYLDGANQDGTIDVWDGDGGRLGDTGRSRARLSSMSLWREDGNTVTTVDFFGTVQRWDISKIASLSSTAPTT